MCAMLGGPLPHSALLFAKAEAFSKIVFGLRRCTSLLVCTGVYKPESSSAEASSLVEGSIPPVAVETNSDPEVEVDHGHRDLPYTEEMTRADHIVYDVKNAIDKIFEIESWFPS